MPNNIFNDMKQKMEKALNALRQETTKLRTGRASLGILDSIRVDYYGTPTPVSQMASLTIPDARTIAIQPWDASAIALIEKAILNSDIGVTPMNDGKLIRINMPTLNEDRRRDLVKVLKKHAEECRVGIRNIRRHANDEVKKQLKEGTITEDEEKKGETEIQKSTDQFNKRIDEIVVNKEKDIMEV